ncbi:hypothetical protein Cni_G21051 [Canna indica]|uniref:Plant heme peroxidase family profile domain-containing protein n=1 Tax=Canna indica TaxID=4628 RepID=A0AAQ3QLC0_9LILI|nr:hypothetical protein Cni_G21051 [Canna indica]
MKYYTSLLLPAALALILVLGQLSAGVEAGELKQHFYKKICPDAEDIVRDFEKRSLWQVKTGRRDGRVSLATEALANIPAASSDFTTLAKEFADKGLGVKDLVVLSGH